MGCNGVFLYILMFPGGVTEEHSVLKHVKGVNLSYLSASSSVIYQVNVMSWKLKRIFPEP